MSAPELSVVCKSCGSEVSPYVTECPYCGHRLRKRAPKLEREGDEIRVHESRRERRRRERRERTPREPRSIELEGRLIATPAVIVIGAILIILGRAIPLSLADSGAIIGPVGSELWRYVTAPFVYDDVGAFFVIGLAIWVLGGSIERRLGSFAALILILATGTLAMLAVGAAGTVGLADPVAAGGNGVALGLLGAWAMLARVDARARFGEPFDTAAVAVAAVVLLLLPLVEVTADPIAGLTGGLVGLGMGALAARRADPEAG